MAMKFEVHYIRNLVDRPLDLQDLEMIIDTSPTLTLFWGGEYVNFMAARPSDGFKEYSLSPTGGSYTLLGYGAQVDIKIYTLEEFCKLSKESLLLVATKVPLIFNTELRPNSLFHETTVTSYTDYPTIISDLEEKGYVEISPSENILRVDERRFALLPKAINLIPSFEKWFGRTYEVDSLGTSYFSDLTRDIVFLSSRYFKEVLRDDKASSILTKDESVK